MISLVVVIVKMSHNVAKRTFGHVRAAKIQISLRIRTVRSESSLSAIWIAKNVKFLHAGAQADFSLRWAHM